MWQKHWRWLRTTKHSVLTRNLGEHLQMWVQYIYALFFLECVVARSILALPLSIAALSSCNGSSCGARSPVNDSKYSSTAASCAAVWRYSDRMPTNNAALACCAPSGPLSTACFILNSRCVKDSAATALHKVGSRNVSQSSSSASRFALISSVVLDIFMIVMYRPLAYSLSSLLIGHWPISGPVAINYSPCTWLTLARPTA